MALIKVSNLAKTYQTSYNFIRALQNCSLEINQGEITEILGPRGAGKTTLLHLISGIDMPETGSVVLNKRDMTTLRQDEMAEYYRMKIGYIFQDFRLFKQLTVYENIYLPVLLNQGRNDNDFLDKLSDRLYIKNIYHHNINKLTKNQLQCIAFLRAMVYKPDIIFADEPTRYLNEQQGNEVMELLTNYVKSYHKTLILTANHSEAYKQADHVIRLNHGNIVEDIKLNR